ncbi:hypothetical protein BB8028_0005g10830 [Beauveria bassiana]|uniref:Uncharacterized protein n=1 Tax=Beauveria bassiana TaxID=176275 RepID=A0A2S7YHA4_BEABA|nr:hypothetical protein BB8028_0005g10830 [Beauveria bassiana]
MQNVSMPAWKYARDPDPVHLKPDRGMRLASEEPKFRTMSASPPKGSLAPQDRTYSAKSNFSHRADAASVIIFEISSVPPQYINRINE